MKNTIKTICIFALGILLLFFSYISDDKISAFFRGSRSALFDAFFSIITNFGVVVVAMLVVPCLIFYKKNKKLVYLLLTTFFASFFIGFFSKLIVHRPRPIEPLTYIFLGLTDYSFPSMHSMVVFSLLPVLAKYLPKQKFFWIASAFLVSFSRIYLGFHFLSDIVFGALAGYFIGSYLLGLHEKGKLWK